MPRRLTQTKSGTHQALKNSSYESIFVSWLMQDGWQVFIPILDHGHSTDILISDGPNFFRIQIKTVEAKGKDQVIENRWKDSHADVVVCFARNSYWGYVMPAFSENKRKLNHDGHQRFQENKKAFHKLD